MVRTLNNIVRNVKKMCEGKTILERPPLVVEIVGPAGAGKSTLLQTLKERNITILEGIRVSTIKNIPLVISTAALLLVTSLCEYRLGRLLTYQEAKLTLFLKVWHKLLMRELPKNDRATVFDHGPITRWVLRKHPHDIADKQMYGKLFEALLNQWVSTLDMVIWLDAPVGTLAERIHKRNKWHEIKDKSEEEAYKILEHYRRSCDQLIAKVTVNGGTRVIHFDTERESVEQIVEKVLAEFDWKRSQG